ncbi:MAG: hypothetical protein WC137_00140 [Alphaproteobacteria bacterium]
MPNIEPKEEKYTGTLEIQFPDNHHLKKTRVCMNDVWPGSDSIIIKSKTLYYFELKELFIKTVSKEIQKIDTSKISPEFLKGSCSSDFCDMPTLRLSSSHDNILFLNPYDFEPQKIITIIPKVSTCYGFIQYCDFRDKKTGCMGCINPYMISVKKIATEMAANIK